MIWSDEQNRKPHILNIKKHKQTNKVNQSSSRTTESKNMKNSSYEAI